jgi:hypothetical protein
MSEHNDPIRDLESFGTGGITMTPIPPSEVRRLGDRRRARRRTTTVLAAVAAAVIVLVPLGIALGHGSDRSTPPILNTPSSTPTSAPAPTEVSYPGPGVAVKTAADTSKLTGTSAGFRSFIAEQLAQISGPASCAEVHVQKYSSAGYAIGAVSSCGGYAALWVKEKGGWHEGLATQDVWDCDGLRYLAVPTSFAGECANEAGSFGPDEVGGVRLGMTVAEVEAAAAGATFENLAPHECASVSLPNGANGVYSPTLDMVAIFAPPGMKTPERIGLGSSLAAVKAAYPDARKGIDYWTVPLAHDAEYELVINEDGTVHEMALTRPTQDCFG